jgi:hypothetical protein
LEVLSQVLFASTLVAVSRQQGQEAKTWFLVYTVELEGKWQASENFN